MSRKTREMDATKRQKIIIIIANFVKSDWINFHSYSLVWNELPIHSIVSHNAHLCFLGRLTRTHPNYALSYVDALVRQYHIYNIHIFVFYLQRLFCLRASCSHPCTYCTMYASHKHKSRITFACAKL